MRWKNKLVLAATCPAYIFFVQLLILFHPFLQAYAFKPTEEPGTKLYADMDWCPGSHEPSESDIEPVDSKLRFLFVIGAQKAGTTWLFRALEKHPSLVHGFTRIV
jgi:hypothetical protein